MQTFNLEYFLDRKLDLPLNSFKTKANVFCNARPMSYVVVKLFTKFYTARETNDRQTFDWMNSISNSKLQSWTKVLGQICTFGHTSDAITSSPVLPRSSIPLPPYNVENYYLQFLMIFNIVLGGRGEEKRVFKRKASLLSNFSSKTQIIR